MACAPLIYFLYSYGTRHPASGGTAAHGVPVYRLAWTSFIHNASTPIRETLDLAAAGDHAPVAETSKSARSSQVDLFTHWGSAPAVTAPPDTIPFSTAFSR